MKPGMKEKHMASTKQPDTLGCVKAQYVTICAEKVNMMLSFLVRLQKMHLFTSPGFYCNPGFLNRETSQLHYSLFCECLASCILYIYSTSIVLIWIWGVTWANVFPLAQRQTLMKIHHSLGGGGLSCHFRGHVLSK